MSEDPAPISIDRSHANAAVVTLNRPVRLNAMTFDMFADLSAILAGLAEDPSVRAIVVTGSGSAFCAGLDLEYAERLPSMSPSEVLSVQELSSGVTLTIRSLPIPVIAAVNGPAAGAGFAIALAADVRLVAPTARFNAAFIRIGLTGADMGTSWLLPRLVGLGRANEILLTGRFVEANEAVAIGLASRLVAADQLLGMALSLADQLAANTPLGVRLTKQAVQVNVDAPSLEAAVALENRNQVLAATGPEMGPALAAFRAQRAKPS